MQVTCFSTWQLYACSRYNIVRKEDRITPLPQSPRALFGISIPFLFGWLMNPPLLGAQVACISIYTPSARADVSCTLCTRSKIWLQVVGPPCPG